MLSASAAAHEDGTAFPPGGRNQFWLIRYTVKTAARKRAVSGHHSAKDIEGQRQGTLQSKIPLYGKFNFTKGSAASRKKHPPVTGRLCRSRRGLAGKFSPCIIARPAARQKAALLPRRCQGCSFPAAKHFFCLPKQAKASSAPLNRPPSRRAAAALLLPPRPRSIRCRK